MPNLILDLIIDRVDLVDEGANAASFIKMYKRKGTEEVMDFEKILKSLKPEHAQVVTDEIAKAKAEATPTDEEATAKKKLADDELADVTDKVAKAKLELGTVTKDVAKAKTSVEPDFEEVMKGLDPAVQSYFKIMKAKQEAAEAVAKDASDKAEQEVAISKAKELKSLPVEEAKLVEVVKNLSPEIFEILKSANKAIEDGGLLDEVGIAKAKQTAGTASAAWDNIEKAAAAIASDQKVTIEKARTLAIKENPELYREYLKGDVN